MTRKSGVILLIITLLVVGYYFLGYNKLQAIKKQETLKFSQKINQFKNNKQELLTLKKLKIKNKKLAEKLQSHRRDDFLTADQINAFIINLNSYSVVQDLNFNSNPTNNLELSFKIRGKFKEIYHFFEEINYIYNTKKLNIRDADDQLNLSLQLIFPIERADQ